MKTRQTHNVKTLSLMNAQDKILLFSYQIFFLAYEEVELNSSVSVDGLPFKQSVNHLQQRATFITQRQDAHYLHWDI